MVYLELFHGRKTSTEQLEDWGAEGPIIGPFPHFHTTYALEIKFGNEGHILTIVSEGLAYYDGMYYGDWSVFSADILDSSDQLKRRVVLFDQDKAQIPEIQT